MRTAVLFLTALMAAPLSSCSRPDPPVVLPQWGNEDEEQGYLDALSNPTPEQYRRREHLRATAEARFQERTRRVFGDPAADRR